MEQYSGISGNPKKNRNICKDYIYQKFEEDDSNCFLEGNVDLVSSPIETLRPHDNKRTLTSKIISNEKYEWSEGKSTTPELSITNSNEGDDDALGENNNDENQTPSLQSSNSLSSMIEKSQEFSNPVWFCLLACGHETGNGLPQVPKRYIRIKNGNMPVSILNKYLVQKLNLQNEMEVEILCCGEPLIPSSSVNEAMKIYMNTKLSNGKINVKINNGSLDAKDFVMQLTYRSRKGH